MSGDRGWQPPRPTTPDAPWEARHRPPGPAAEPSESPSETVPPPTATRPPRGGALGRRWHRASRGRRVGLATVVLAVATTLIAALCVPGQPRYGAASAWQGIDFVDLRAAPSTDGWRLDLASTLAPGAPPECLRYRSETVAPGLALVRAAGAWTYGFANDGDCGAATKGVGTRVALLDVRLGRIVWLHDVGDDLRDAGLTGTVAVTDMTALRDERSADETPGPTDRVVVRATAGARGLLLALDRTTGRTVSTSGPLTVHDSDQFQSVGDVVATGYRPPGGGPYRYELRAVDDLSTIVWSGTGTTTGVALALADRLVVAQPSGTVQIDVRTGRSTAWGTRLDVLIGYTVHHGLVIAPRGPEPTSGSTAGVEALDADGRTVWTSTVDVRGAYSATRACLVVTDITAREVTCLDYATGESRWSRSLPSFTSADGLTGQTDDTVYALSQSSNGGLTELRALSGGSGGELFRSSLPDGSVLVAAGRTVGYALAYGTSGGRSQLIAFDLDDGRRLWSHTAELQAYAWAGRLVDIDVSGVARELTAPEARVVGSDD
ncbi:PQQ-binding-like beta-propeller repeat protein [Frigoribacterium sp. 2-23]|uniref:outer membrane protein assembly factor BamB family protein n=1 Tax=Frigoribacterium sp. 2-23 TaxID=3415006 RepID=UPI003C705717